MLLALLLNLGMAASNVDVPPPAPPTNDYADGFTGKLQYQKNKERIEKIKKDDEEVLSIIKMFLENAE